MAEEQQPGVEASAATSAPVPEAPTKADIAAKEREERRRLPPGQRVYRRVDLPTPEMMQQEEFMNNCATRTGLSAVMGSALGVVFGIFMGTMESSVSLSVGEVDISKCHVPPAHFNPAPTYIFLQHIDGTLST